MLKDKGLWIITASILAVILIWYGVACNATQPTTQLESDALKEVVALEMLESEVVEAGGDQVSNVSINFANDSVEVLSAEEADARSVGYTWETPMKLQVK